MTFGHCAKYTVEVVSFITPTNPQERFYCEPYFTDGDTDAQKGEMAEVELDPGSSS